MHDDLDTFARTGYSTLQAHTSQCCSFEHARLHSLVAAPSVESTLARIPALVAWGPTSWPAHVCELRQPDGTYVGDCGVHAALAAEVLQQRGITFDRAQVALAGSELSREHWAATWTRAEVNDRWIGTETVYHEVLHISGRFWDPSEARWFDGPGSYVIAGQVAAVRIGLAGRWQT